MAILLANKSAYVQALLDIDSHWLRTLLCGSMLCLALRRARRWPIRLPMLTWLLLLALPWEQLAPNCNQFTLQPIAWLTWWQLLPWFPTVALLAQQNYPVLSGLPTLQVTITNQCAGISSLLGIYTVGSLMLIAYGQQVPSRQLGKLFGLATVLYLVANSWRMTILILVAEKLPELPFDVLHECSGLLFWLLLSGLTCRLWRKLYHSSVTYGGGPSKRPLTAA